MLGQKNDNSKKILVKKWTNKIQEKKVGQIFCHLKNYSLHLISVTVGNSTSISKWSPH